jgi:hypothetical protein
MQRDFDKYTGWLADFRLVNQQGIAADDAVFSNWRTRRRQAEAERLIASAKSAFDMRAFSCRVF